MRADDIDDDETEGVIVLPTLVSDLRSIIPLVDDAATFLAVAVYTVLNDMTA